MGALVGSDGLLNAFQLRERHLKDSVGSRLTACEKLSASCKRGGYE